MTIKASTFCAVALLLAACAPQGRGSPPMLPSSSGPTARKAFFGDWMAQGVRDDALRKADLLYISDGNGEVTVYDFLQKTLVGELTHFVQPLGECVDAGGNVFIADHGRQELLEYAHGGKRPLKRIVVAPYEPYGCSVDPSSGTLAVANDRGNAANGNIELFAAGQGSPMAIYSDPNVPVFESCAFDNKGNLLATNGQAGNRNASAFAWLPKGGHKLIDINIPGPSPSSEWTYVQGVGWDGLYWAIEQTNVYRVSLIKGQAYYVGYTPLEVEGSAGPYWFFAGSAKKQATEVIGAVNSGGFGEVDYWDYPAGGEAIVEVNNGIDAPYGVAVSLAQTR
jgi:hypothetical protein